MSNEQERLLDYEAQQQDRQLTLKERTANALESNVLHYTVIVLVCLPPQTKQHNSCFSNCGPKVFVDTSFVLADLIYTLLTPNCTPTGPDSPLWLEVLSNLSLAITTLFLLEIPFSLWALGFQHYNPVGGAPHASLHAFDAVVITTTFVLELALKGRERELAGLLVILRLWRLVKLVGGSSTYPFPRSFIVKTNFLVLRSGGWH